MMISETLPYWIDTTGLADAEDGTRPRMAIVPCPAGGQQLEASLRWLRTQGIESLVSLLRADENRVLHLDTEGKICQREGIDFKWLPVPDHSIPESLPEFRLVAEHLQRELRAGKAIGAHCYAGIGRSCMLLACLLCLEGLKPEEAFARLSAARGVPVPDTWLQTQWVEHFAESLAAENELKA